VDILLLFEKKVPETAAELVREIIYPLWDLGMDVGHATRSLSECISEAKNDIEVLTAMFDARFLCGMSTLYSALMEKLRDAFVHRQSGKMIRRLIERNRERHNSFGDSSYLLEPNLKEGQGGLRDYHTLLWIARIRNNLTQPRDLEYDGLFTHEEYNTLRRSLTFIWDVRNRLHYLAKRKCDQLYFSYQEKLADAMGYAAENGQQPVERFLGELHRHMNFLKHQHQIRVYEIEMARAINIRRMRRPSSPGVPGIEIKNRMLHFQSSRAVYQDPSLLIRIFRESARQYLPLSLEARRLVREFLNLVDMNFRQSPEIRFAFEDILLTPVPKFNVLEAMSDTEFLTAYIPQLALVADRIQYDEYHLYPVDKHLLRTVQTIKKFGTDEDPCERNICGQLYIEMPRKERLTLIWAALLHDIGKGEPGGDHSNKGEKIAREIMTEKGYGPDMIEDVAFLVREHLLLVKIATRRDIQDEETALLCARRIGDITRLKMLLLLTVADSKATGPNAWNAWTGTLLEEMFLHVNSTLQNGELTSREAMEQVESKKDQILRSAETEAERRGWPDLIHIMSPRYMLYTDARDIVHHIRLFEKLGDTDFVWQVETAPDSDTRLVTICTRDVPGLFSRIAGVFTLHGVDIRDALVYTWRNNMALDVFKVSPPPDTLLEDRQWERIASALHDALAGRLDLREALKSRLKEYGHRTVKARRMPPRVVVDNQMSSFFTIIEVFAHDFTGLLFGVTDALFRCRLDVYIAKIATQVDQIVDVFYVRDFDGQKLDSPEQIETVRSAIEAFLNEWSP